MSLNSTPAAIRTHIGFFGLCNAGKSSVVNAITGQEMAIVSQNRGTTTDPVSKTMELLPLGPVVIIDTPGLDDESALGEERVRRTRRVLARCDIAILVHDATTAFTQAEKELVSLFEQRALPYLVVHNKMDLVRAPHPSHSHTVWASATTGEGIQELKEAIGHLGGSGEIDKPLVRDLLRAGQTVVLVTPIDSSAPKGRMILPQQQAIRDVLEADCGCVVVVEDQLRHALGNLREKPAMVITDSQAFERVAKDTPLDIPLTSFSILMARYKGFLRQAVEGVVALERLQDGDTVLISEGCTHHRQCMDIGTVKIPRWLFQHTGKQLHIETSSGTGFPEDLSRYRVVIHCGGCMLNAKEVQYRMRMAQAEGVPMTNYGVAIAQMKGILKRSLALFPDIAKLVD